MSSADDGLFGSRLMLESLRLLGGGLSVLLEVLLLLLGLLFRPTFLLPPLGLRRRGDLDGLLLLGLCDRISLLIFGMGDLGGDFFVLQLPRLSTLFERDLRELLDRDLRLDDLEGDLLRPLIELGLLLGDRGLLFDDLKGDLLRPLTELGLLLGDRGLLFGDLKGDLLRPLIELGLLLGDRGLLFGDLKGDLLRPLMELGLLLGDLGLLFGDLKGDLPPRTEVGLESCRRRDAVSPDWLWQGLRDRRPPLRLLLYPLLGLGDLLKPLRLLLEGLLDMRLQEAFRRLSDHRK